VVLSLSALCERLKVSNDLLYSLDPVWTLKNGSLFLMTVESKELFLSEGLTFLIKDYDLVGRNESLGLIVVSPQDLYAGKGERMEFKLEPPPGSNKKEVDGYMAIRVRHATEYDKKFIEGYKQSLRAASAPEHPRSVNSDLRSIVTRKYKTDKTGTKQVSYFLADCAYTSCPHDSSFFFFSIGIVQNSAAPGSKASRG
jgi:hypothetical protein